MTIVKETQSVCPVCLRVLDARLVARADGIYMEKECPAHGGFSVLVWEGDAESWRAWDTGNPKKDDIPAAKPAAQGCPLDCGLCSAHIRAGCCVLLELTSRCNLRCPVCFASAGAEAPEPGLDEIGKLLDSLMARGGPFNIQLSGGEPTLRDDLPEIIRMGREKGFDFFQLNTNGLRLAREKGYAEALARAGLDAVFLQFDGLSDRIYTVLRGRPLLREKLAAIRRCAAAGLGVVLVPTVAPGVNAHCMGEMIRFAEKHMPAIRGVHFQPISYFGRCALPAPDKRLTIPALLSALESQTGGRLKAADFSGGGAENPYCSFHASYMKLPGGGLKALKKRAGACCRASSKQSRERVARQWRGVSLRVKNELGAATQTSGFDEFLAEARSGTLAVSGMLFQDAWNLDLDRLRRCYICEADPRYGMVPFCAYNLTAEDGRTLYRSRA